MEKGIFIKDILPGDSVTGLFCVGSKRLLETKNGMPYLAITLVDKSGEIEGRVWDEALRYDRQFAEGDFVSIEGEGKTFGGTLQLKINILSVVGPDKVDPSLFLPVAPVDLDSCWDEFIRFANKIKCPILGHLLRTLIKDTTFTKAFRTAPAAKKMHHAYIGGLLEHSVAVARMARAVSRLYGHLDQDLLMSGALLHDIGKIKEFRYDRPPIDYSDQGRLLGHMALGISMLEGYLESLGLDASAPRVLALKHLILSHHGQREFGSPVLPMMEEAVALHMIDDLDAKLNFLGRLKEDLPEGEYQWTGFQRLFDRYFFLQGRSGRNECLDGTGEDAGEAVDDGPLQQSLWRRTG